MDLTVFGGVSHQIVYDTYVHNYSVLRAYVKVAITAFFLDAFDPLLALIYGHLAIGDGTFEEVAADQYGFSGSGGYALSLIYALPTTQPVRLKRLTWLIIRGCRSTWPPPVMQTRTASPMPRSL